MSIALLSISRSVNLRRGEPRLTDTAQVLFVHGDCAGKAQGQHGERGSCSGQCGVCAGGLAAIVAQGGERHFKQGQRFIVGKFGQWLNR